MPLYLDTHQSIFAVRFFPFGHAKHTMFAATKQEGFTVDEIGNGKYVLKDNNPELAPENINKGDWIVEMFDDEGYSYFTVMSDDEFRGRYVTHFSAIKNIQRAAEYRVRCALKYGNSDREDCEHGTEHECGRQAHHG